MTYTDDKPTKAEAVQGIYNNLLSQVSRLCQEAEQELAALHQGPEKGREAKG